MASITSANSREGSTAASATPTPSRSVGRNVVLVLTCTIAMLTNTAASSIGIILPVIGVKLGIRVDQLQWLISAFSLSSGCLLLLFGRLADLFGRKKVFLFGTIWLTAFSIGCGFAQNSTALFILRGLQGVGPAAFIPACLGILAHAFPPSRARTIAFASFSAGAPLGGAIGMQLGAVLTQYSAAGWRATFFLFAGLSALCVIGGYYAIDPDQSSTEEDQRVDWIGAFLVTSGLILVVFALAQGPVAPRGWKTGYIIALIIVGVVLIALFLLWEHRLEHGEQHRPPLMKLSLWTRAKGKFAVIQIIAFLEWASFLSWFFWLVVYYENYRKLSLVHTSIRGLPSTVTGLFCNVFIVIFVSRVDVGILVAFGTGVTGIAALLFAIIDPNATYWSYGFVSAILGVFGADFVFASGTLFVAKVALPHEQSLAGGIFQTLTQLGTSFGVAISTIVFNSVAGSDNAGEDAPLKAYKAAQWACAGMAFFCSLLAILFMRGVGPVGVDERKVALSEVDAESRVSTFQKDEKNLNGGGRLS
ncbi:MFS general substrate transporter [Favolaschia claudopus]|uniref:MFS general substrate transporter n=1 Tax=Favolaschia claudopus TaxID=2862362 RepID=A0AAW0BZF9_9AGAR